METTVKIFLYIRAYLTVHPTAPSFRQIAAAVGLAWPSSVRPHLDHLIALGFLACRFSASGRMLPRSVRLTPAGECWLTLADTGPVTVSIPIRHVRRLVRNIEKLL